MSAATSGQVYLVTGASGFLGGHLVRRLARDGHEVVALTRRELDLGGDAASGRVHAHALDLRDTEAIRRVAAEHGVTVAVNCAAYGVRASDKSALECHEVNTTAVLALAEVALDLGWQRFIHIGSGFEYEPRAVALDESAPLRPTNLYGVSKAAASMYLEFLHRTRDLPVTILRPFSMYGPGEHPERFFPFMVQRALRGEAVDLTPGRQVRDYLFVDDVVAAILLAAGNEGTIGKVFNLGAGASGACMLRDVVLAICAAAGAPPDIAGFGRRAFARPEPPYFVADTTRAHLELGWWPSVLLKDGIERTVAYYRDRTAGGQG